MRRFGRGAVAALALAGVAAVGIPAFGRPPRAPDASLGAAGINGSAASMQTVDFPARVARVAEVPGSGGSEAWALATSRGSGPGWERSGRGQTVLLHYSSLNGWSIAGPPVDRTGKVRNPLLANIALAPNGEGWAVGPGGAAIHLRPGASQWVEDDVCPAVSCADLVGLALFSSNTGLRGYAVGTGSAVLALANGTWKIDTQTVVSTTSTTVDLVSVAATAAGDAWAVTGPTSRSLEIYHRTPNGWTRVMTGQPIFDGPHPNAGAGAGSRQSPSLGAYGTAAQAGRGSDNWLAGGLYPIDPSSPSGDRLTGDSERPFTIRIANETAITTFCPKQYGLSGATPANAPAAAGMVITSDLCNQPMPLSPFDITSLSITPEGDLFAGGLGLYHFKDSVWFREPDSLGYLASVSFASPTEGWVAASGDTIGGGGGTARSSVDALGHFTRNPQTPRTARWPQPNQQVLQDVAVSPTGDMAVAAGSAGAFLVRRPDMGWDALPHGSEEDLHGVAWAGPTEAWAVGNNGLLLKSNGITALEDPLSSKITTQALEGVAFDGNGRGFAVGTTGTILGYDHGKWAVDPASGSATKRTLYAIARVGTSFVAVGESGTALVNRTGAAGAWQPDATIATALASVSPKPNLWAVDGLVDGSEVVGGSNSTLLVRDGSGSLNIPREPIDGHVVAAAVRRDPGGKLSTVVALADTPDRIQGGLVAASRTSLLRYDGTRWSDLDLGHHRSIDPNEDLGAPRDAVLAIDLAPDGRSGWAVGGIRANLPDGEGHVQQTPSSSVYRIDLEHSPAAPGTDAHLSLPSGPNIATFAFFADSSCGKGLCSLTAGSNPASDAVVTAIQREINGLSHQPDGPKFVLFGGSSRGIGVPEDLAEFSGFLANFDVPVFGAPGTRDIFQTLGAGAGGLQRPTGVLDQVRTNGTPSVGTPANQFYLEAFANQPVPWGTAPAERDFVPVAIGAAPTPGLARTHYAVDYAPKGKPLLRIVVLDTTDGTAAAAQGQQTQNPPETQTSFLTAVLGDATTRNIPTIITMNEPSTDATVNPRTPLLTDGTAFEGTVTGAGVSGVFAGFQHQNLHYDAPTTGAPKAVPFYVAGTGGAPTGSTRYPSDGGFHSWLLAIVDTTGVNGVLQPQAKVKVLDIPVLESIALHARDGLLVEGGKPLNFEAIGRGVDGGGPNDDPRQSLRQYLKFPVDRTCDFVGAGNGSCFGASVTRPDYHFVSEDPSIAQFVRADTFRTYLPAKVNGKVVPDDQSGMLCTFKSGTVWVDVISGTHRSRERVTVDGGAGPCVDKPVAAAIVPKVVVPGAVSPVPVIAPQAPHAPHFTHPPVNPDLNGVVLPPSPTPVAAPAPPASAAGARKEEEEVEHQSADQEGDGAHHQFSAVPIDRRRPMQYDELLTVAALLFASLLGVATYSVVRRPNYAHQRVEQ